MKIKDIDKYIKLYDTEKYLFDVVGFEAKSRGYLTFKEFYQIAMWKSVRPKKRYIANENKQHIKSITKMAFARTNEVEKIKLLCELKGVAIPTASAILTIVFPEKYAVIDVRCMETLREKFKQEIGKYVSLKTWSDYLRIMRKLAKENNITPRELDMALFAMHREKLEKEDFRNLY